MSHEDTQEEIQSLGAFLRTHREEKRASLTDVTEATRISLPVLKAIEEDEYDCMPADAFCRGFYTLYANFLELDPKTILERYGAGREREQSLSKKPAKPPIVKSESSTNYAEASYISPAAGMVIFSAVCLIIFAGICWYFNWNPVDYIDTKLMPQQIATKQPTQPIQETPAAPQPNAIDIEGSPDKVQTSSLEAAPYQLEINFNNSGTLKVTLDDGFVLDKGFSEGETLRWKVEKKIILDMPEEINGILRLNGIEIPLPEAENGRRTLSLPEDLLN